MVLSCLVRVYWVCPFLVKVKGSEKNDPNLEKIFYSKSVTPFILFLFQMYFEVSNYASNKLFISSKYNQNCVKISSDNATTAQKYFKARKIGHA
jgi:hypothetical protein